MKLEKLKQYKIFSSHPMFPVYVLEYNEKFVIFVGEEGTKEKMNIEEFLTEFKVHSDNYLEYNG